MRVRISRIASISAIGIYLVLAGTGLYAQWTSGNHLFDGLFPFAFLVGAGFALTAWVAIGCIIIWYLPANRIGVILVLFSLTWAMDMFTWGHYQISLVSNAGMHLAVQASLVWQNWSDFPPALFTLSFLFLLFPTGKTYPPGRRWISWFGILAYAGYLATETLKPGEIFPGDYQQVQDNPINPLGLAENAWSSIQPLSVFFLFALLAFLVYAIGSLIQRLYKSRGDERQQIKWFTFFGALFAALSVAAVILERFSLIGSFFRIAIIPVLIASTGMSVAIAFAIFKYRLYDIDILINRTLVYGTLTGLLALVYFTLVTLLQNLLSTFSGQQSTAAIVISTLAIAALFTPLRRRIQEIIDRRFYRRKYDAAKTLEAFSATVREEVDLADLSGALLSAVEESLQPASASLWLKE